jgi:Zn-finger nucleic acid-binding protein
MNEKASSIRKNLEKEGYSKEDEYFYRINRELIESKRKELDRTRAEQRASGVKSIHWMKCPKCGNQMDEVDFSGIHADQCSECQGVYFDHGEFETLLEAKMPKSFVRSLLKRFRVRMSQFNTTWKP